MKAKPKYILFAGVNGAGKSTLYQSMLWVDSKDDIDSPRVNPDEILRNHGWDWSQPVNQFAAGKLAVKKIHSLIESRTTFNQETTLAGRFIVKNIKKAAELGYEIHVNYVGVESPEIAQKRIAHRVDIGGHDIGKDDVNRRFQSSADNLVTIFPRCSTIKFFDNTQSLCLVAYAEPNTIVNLQPSNNSATWYKTILMKLQPYL